MAHPYTRRFEEYEPGNDASLLLGPDGASSKVKIHQDGSIEATKFLDTTDNLELFVDRGEVKARFQLDYSTEAEVSLSGGGSFYRSSRGMVLHYNNSLFVYGFALARYSHLEMDRFLYLSKSARHSVIQTQGAGGKFVFHYSRNNKNWSIPNQRSTWCKPFKDAVHLRATEEIRELNDLIIIKTGRFRTGPGGVNSGIHKEKIVWVSPHEELSFTGFIEGTGTYHHSGKNGLSRFSGAAGPGSWFTGQNDARSLPWTGASGSFGFTKKAKISYLSSKNYIIPSGTVFKSAVVGSKFDVSGTKSAITGEATITGTNFYSEYATTGDELGNGLVAYTGQSKVPVLTGYNWDGVIPANTPYKIEVWSANGEKMGFHGRVEAVPTGLSEFGGNLNNFNITVSGSGEGIDMTDPRNAQGMASTLAHVDCLRKLDNLLILAGWRASGSNMKKYHYYMNKLYTGVI